MYAPLMVWFFSCVACFFYSFFNCPNQEICFEMAYLVINVVFIASSFLITLIEDFENGMKKRAGFTTASVVFGSTATSWMCSILLAKLLEALLIPFAISYTKILPIVSLYCSIKFSGDAKEMRSDLR